MKKEDVVLLAQLLHAMREAADKIGVYFKRNDMANLESAKREVLEIQAKINQLLV